MPLALAFHWNSFFDKIHSWGFSLRWTAFMCHWHYNKKIFLGIIHTYEFSQWGGLPLCAINTGIWLKVFFGKIFTHEAFHWGGLPLCAIGTGISLYFFSQNSHSWGFSFLWIALMCHWHWHFTESFNFKKITHEASHWGGLPLCTIGTGLSIKNIFWQNLVLHWKFWK